MKYQVIKESFEFSKKISEVEIRKNALTYAIEQGLMNGVYKRMGIFDNKCDANKLADSNPVKYSKLNINQTWIWSVEIVYVEELDDDEEPTGNYYFKEAEQEIIDD